MPNSHDNIPSILSITSAASAVCGEWVTAIPARSTRHHHPWAKRAMSDLKWRHM